MTLEITEEWDGQTLWKQEDLVAFAPELATAAEMEEDDEECGEDCDCEDCMEDKSVGNCPKCGSNSYSMRDKMPEGGYTTCSKCGEKNKTSDWYKTSKSEVEIEIEVKPEGECECESPEPQESESKKSCAKCGKKIADTTKKTLASIANILVDLKEFKKKLATVMELTVMNSENTNKTIMLTSFADINEEFLKTAQANELREFLEKQVAESASKASEQLKSEKAAVESEKAALANELETLKKQLADKESQLSALIAEKSQATAQELFSKRMAYFDDKFDLAAEDKQVIAKVLKEVKDDEAFAAYQKDMDILLKGKVKGAKEAVASTVVVNEDKIVKAALDNADPEKVTVTAGSVKEEPKTFIERYAKYFALNQENFTKR